jgi:hypothetical protein
MANHPGVSRWSRTMLLAGALALPGQAANGPTAGSPLPSFSAKDLLGQEHSSRQFSGQRTLIVAITDKNAGHPMRRWFEAADVRLPATVQRASLVSLQLPFVVSLGTARRYARQHVPQRYWESTLLDRDGAMAEALGLPFSEQPYVFSVDEHGRIVAVVHGPPDSPDAGLIWSSFSGH